MFRLTGRKALVTGHQEELVRQLHVVSMHEELLLDFMERVKISLKKWQQN